MQPRNADGLYAVGATELKLLSRNITVTEAFYHHVFCFEKSFLYTVYHHIYIRLLIVVYYIKIVIRAKQLHTDTS